MQTRCVNDYQLALRSVGDSSNSPSSGLRFFTRDGNFLADQGISESGFANIWSSNKRNESCFIAQLAPFSQVWLEFDLFLHRLFRR